MMIVEIATITVADGKDKLFIDGFAEAQKYLAACPNCLRYQLTRCIEIPERFVLRIEWDTLEGHTEVFRGSPEYQLFRNLLYPHYSGPPEVVHYEEVSLPALTA